jgi:uncharacterized membrane protein
MNGKIGNFFFTLLFSFAFVLAFENIYQSICSFIESVVVTARFEFRSNNISNYFPTNSVRRSSSP